jgi:hypothetical protein
MARRSHHLKLVSSVARSDKPGRSGPAMAPRSPGCRPSELPTRILLELTPKAAARGQRASAASGIGLPLWIRLAVESTRQVDRAAERLGIERTTLVRALDAAASRNDVDVPLAAAPLAAYVRALAIGTSHACELTDNRIAVPLPDELVAAWSREAGRIGQVLDAWASSMVLNAPEAVAGWERAAALAGCYLAEWVLLEAASAQRASARPQA